MRGLTKRLDIPRQGPGSAALGLTGLTMRGCAEAFSFLHPSVDLTLLLRNSELTLSFLLNTNLGDI